MYINHETRRFKQISRYWIKTTNQSSKYTSLQDEHCALSDKQLLLILFHWTPLVRILGQNTEFNIGKPDSVQKIKTFFSALEKLVGEYKHLLDRLILPNELVGFTIHLKPSILKCHILRYWFYHFANTAVCLLLPSCMCICLQNNEFYRAPPPAFFLGGGVREGGWH